MKSNKKRSGGKTGAVVALCVVLVVTILLGWIADTVASVLLYLLFFRTEAHIERAIRHATK